MVLVFLPTSEVLVSGDFCLELWVRAYVVNLPLLKGSDRPAVIVLLLLELVLVEVAAPFPRLVVVDVSDDYKL